jgi:hypothetical protein
MDEIQTMTADVQWLDIVDKPNKRGVHKGGSRMITCEIRYKYGKLVWYVHFFLCVFFFYLSLLFWFSICLYGFSGFNDFNGSNGFSSFNGFSTLMVLMVLICTLWYGTCINIPKLKVTNGLKRWFSL